MSVVCLQVVSDVGRRFLDSSHWWTTAFLDSVHQRPPIVSLRITVTTKTVPSLCTSPARGKSIPPREVGHPQGGGCLASLVNQSRNLPDCSAHSCRRRRKWEALGGPAWFPCQHQALSPGAPPPECALLMPLASHTCRACGTSWGQHLSLEGLRGSGLSEPPSPTPVLLSQLSLVFLQP